MAAARFDTVSKNLRALDLAPGASLDDIKRAYRDLAKVWHPDRFADSDVRLRAKAEAKFRDISAAYEWLCRHPAALSAVSRTRPEIKQPPARAARPAAQDASARAAASPPLAVSAPRQRPRGRWALLAAMSALAVMLGWTLSPSAPVTPPQVRERPPRAAQSSAASSEDAAEHDGAAAADEATDQWWFRVLSSDKRHAAREVKVPASAGLAGEQKPPTFTLGSTEDEVRAVQGMPSDSAGDTWTYELSSVRFVNGRAAAYANVSGNLKVHLEPAGDVSAARALGYFTRGSSEDEVLAVQGTPTSVSGDTWTYGPSFVRFIDRRVAVYSNASGDLRVGQNELGIPPQAQRKEQVSGR